MRRVARTWQCECPALGRQIDRRRAPTTSVRDRHLQRGRPTWATSRPGPAYSSIGREYFAATAIERCARFSDGRCRQLLIACDAGSGLPRDHPGRPWGVRPIADRPCDNVEPCIRRGTRHPWCTPAIGVRCDVKPGRRHLPIIEHRHLPCDWSPACGYGELPERLRVHALSEFKRVDRSIVSARPAGTNPESRAGRRSPSLRARTPRLTRR